MTAYSAPIRDMLFVINELAGVDHLARLPGYEDVNGELMAAVLEEAGRLAGEVLAPLNRGGDLDGSRWDEHGVTTPPGFADAYRQFVAGGWNGLKGPLEHGGQGLPELLNTAVIEMWNSANLSFALCPLLTSGAVEALKKHGSAEQQRRFLTKLVTGEWTGTMNLTEPQAGSDLAAVRTRAVPEGDHYRLFGQKIFITWGEHDVADNIIHLVLARTPDAPPGVKGISLFLVPKVLVNDDGSLGERNDVHCVSLEHKLGINASPTCVMAYGDHGGAIGYLVGEENRGLAHMFTMMNEARIQVGIQGLAIAERAYQQAVTYARERIQGRAVGNKDGDRVSIIHHADVRRMLLSMKAQIEAMRAFAYVMAADMDQARRQPDAAVRQASQARVDLLIPVVKGWCTELGVELASTGLQVHGGVGFIEETGAAQHYRDARILPIYEGTTGIQANDLVARKLAMDKGAAMASLLDDMRRTSAGLAGANEPALVAIRGALDEAVDALAESTDVVLAMLEQEPAAALGQAVNYLHLTGYTCGGWQLARAARIASERLAAGVDPAFHRAKLLTARFYAEQVLPRTGALARSIKAGSEALLELDESQF